MAHKSPYTDEIYAFWDELVFGDGAKLPIEQRVEGWEKLHGMCWQNHEWIVGFDDAGLSAIHGVTLAMQQQRWSDARQLANEYLNHPDVKNHSKNPGISQAFGYEVCAGILCGDVEQSAQKNLIAIDTKAFGRMTSLHLHVSIGNLNGTLMEMGEGDIDPFLKQYAFELVKRFPGFKRSASEAKEIKTLG